MKGRLNFAKLQIYLHKYYLCSCDLSVDIDINSDIIKQGDFLNWIHK